MRQSDEISFEDSAAQLDVRMQDLPEDQKQPVDIAAALLRYWWVVCIPAVVGLVIGAVAWTQLPETYESASRLLVESDRPVILDSTTGETVKGIPGADVIQAQLFSDQVMAAASRDSRLQVPELQEIIAQEYTSFAGFAMRAVEFEPETIASKTSTSLAFRLTVRHTSDELVYAASQALHQALIEYFDQRREDSIVKLRSFITAATENYQPKLAELEERHRDFQRENPLEFDINGNAINPHRIRIQDLKQEEAALSQRLGELNAKLTMVEATLRDSDDPVTAIDILGQYLRQELVPPVRRKQWDLTDENYDIKRLGFEQQLVPLLVARAEAVGRFGENHPTVQSLDQQIKYSKAEFEKIAREYIAAVKEAMNDREAELEEAKVACKTVVTALQAEIAHVRLQINEIRSIAESERTSAEELAAAEQMHRSMMREIEQANGLLSTLKEQMARVNLADKQGGIYLVPLNKPSGARIVGPNLLLLLAGGLGVGLLLGCGFAYLLESQAGTFRTSEEIQSYLGSPVIAHVPFDPGKRSRLRKGEESAIDRLDDKLSVLHRPASMAAEAIRACRTAVFFEASLRGSKVIQVTSPLPSEGKTTLGGNLAVSIAQAGKSVIIVDCDLRRPQLSDNFALGEVMGLTNVLNGDCDPVSAIHLTPVKNLSVMPSGPIPLNPAEALTLPEMGELVEWLRDRYDYVILDTPPLLVVTDPSIVAGLVDGVLLTLKIRRKSKPNAREAVSILRGVGANLLGVIVNASDDASGSDGYRGYGYYKYSRYASKYNSESGYSKSERGGTYSSKGKSRGTLYVGGRNGSAGMLESGSNSAGPRNGSVGGNTMLIDDDNEE